MSKLLNIIGCMVFVGCASTNSPSFSMPEQQGEKQMATLIFDEQFQDITGIGNSRSLLAPLATRGWGWAMEDPASAYWEYDNELQKTVTYFRWTNGKTQGPDHGTSGSYQLWHDIPASAMNTGITLHFTVKYQNFINNGGCAHGNIYLHQRGATGSLNSPGEITIDPARVSCGAATVPDNSRDVYRTFTIMNNGSNYSYRTILQPDMTFPFLEDGPWYDVVVYIRVNNGGANQRWALWAKEHSATEYHKHIDYQADGIQNLGPTAPKVYITSYSNTNTTRQEMRIYTGNLTVWAGDAMADGQIPGGGDNGGGTEPDDPLAISNHKASTTDTTAALTWTTNKPSNSVVDYGDTETRGTMARDDNNVTDHTIILSGLTPNTAYYYRYSSRTADGETVMDQTNSTFMTKETDNGGGTEPVEVSLDGLTDVTLTAPVKGQVIMFDGEKWVNVDAKPMITKLVEDILGVTSLVVKT